MAIEYLGLSEINGPLVVLEGVTRTLPTMRSWSSVWRTETKSWVVSSSCDEDKAVIQVFEGTDSMSLMQYAYHA